jgi:hypothetical protein
MEEKSTQQSVQTAIPAEEAAQVQSAGPSPERAGSEQRAEHTQEHRQAYGTAKTENLRDSGWWRFLLPAFVVVACLMLLAFPLFILGPLLATSINANSAVNQQHIPLTWLWIFMIVIEVGMAALIIWGLVRIFMTQAGNYRG